MTDKKKGLTLAPNELAFLVGLTDLARQHGLTPRATLPLFGHLARTAAFAEHMQRGTALQDALNEAVTLMVSGTGVSTLVDVTLAPANPQDKDLH